VPGVPELHISILGNNTGSGGREACIEVCPQHLIKVTSQIPEQHGDSEYDTEIKDVAGDQV